MPYFISKDGETWYEVENDVLHSLMDDPKADCLVELSGDRNIRIVTLDQMRCFLKEAEARPPVDWNKKPTHLYGIPVVFEEAK